MMRPAERASDTGDRTFLEVSCSVGRLGLPAVRTIFVVTNSLVIIPLPTYGKGIITNEFVTRKKRLGNPTAAEEAARIRNDVMHFHPDGISPDDMELLRDTRKFLQML